MINPVANENAETLIERISSEAPEMASWDNMTANRPEFETLLAYCRSKFKAKPRADLSPGDVLVFRMTDTQAARDFGVVGSPLKDSFFFSYDKPGRDDLQTEYLNHFWRTRLVAVFSVPEEFLARVQIAAE